MDPATKPATRAFEDATPLLARPEALRREAKAKGYLFFKGFLEREEVMDARRLLLNILDEEGLLDPARPLMDGFGNQPVIDALKPEEINWNGIGTTQRVYHRVQKLEAFHAFAQHPKLMALFDALFGERTFPHPRNIARIMLPSASLNVTPPHQDFLHIQGSADTWTCWAPMGDVPRSLGGLSILEGSHEAGLLGVTANPGAGGLESILCGLGYEWAEGDYEAGDIVVFHSHTVHKALPNREPGRVRLSLDLRYQPASQPIERASLLPHGPFEWEELYEGWTREDLKYYWRREDFAYLTFDESIRWQKDKIC
ncbi:Phytanoyl-CoA dioxygenase (PhyH) [Paenibacillus sp. UNC496MF]|uniref:phytanoyl-CoA dioxygenase family protein n=1 Tax=Paenibacillus sp. UNC496MF TaxID=1502753 RepID=UPI0008E826E1|nr:phytanoyl-CoA dioxygenase family protein [Paenibacillus sp. UNC496MF]SFI81525.1 Phytanoyl-CoA dioxygenase (PhyH) [Paenibacillus sp. UNC496MF]